MHLGRSGYYRRVHVDVDLSAYRRAGWRVVDPQVYFHPTDPGDHALCAQRTMINPDPPQQVDPSGIWRWDLEFVTEGVIDLVWDVVAPAAADAASATIRLAPGEHAVFGYGSLLSIASLERTLGRRYTGPFRVCAIGGWRRRWNVAMPNETFMYRDGERWVTPRRIFYLNVEADAASTTNGILFIVNEQELARFDAREWIYDRVDVSAALLGVSIENGSAWVYCGKPEYVSAHPATPEEGAIRRTYLDILDAGHRALGADFVRAYDASTDAVPPSLVVDDVRRDDVSIV
jgi:hypothetical protein